MAHNSTSDPDAGIAPGVAVANPSADQLPTPEVTNRIIMPLLIVGMLGGTLGALIADQFYGSLPRPAMSEKYYQESEEKWATMDFSDDVVAEMKWADSVVMARNSGLALGIIGMILCGFFGAATGSILKRPLGARYGFLGGTVVGGLFGMTAGYIGVQLLDFLSGFQVQISGPGDLNSAWLRTMYFTIFMHAVEWCVVALAVMLSVSLAEGFRALPSKRLAGLLIVAAVFAAVAYMPVAASLFAGFDSEIPFPEGRGNRLLFTLLPSVGMAAMLGITFRTSHA